MDSNGTVGRMIFFFSSTPSLGPLRAMQRAVFNLPRGTATQQPQSCRCRSRSRPRGSSAFRRPKRSGGRAALGLLGPGLLRYRRVFWARRLCIKSRPAACRTAGGLHFFGVSRLIWCVWAGSVSGERGNQDWGDGAPISPLNFTH
jgi:hypothetical protein